MATWRASSAGASRWAWSASTCRSPCPWPGTALAAGRAACSGTCMPTGRKACASTRARSPSCSAGRRARPAAQNSHCQRGNSAPRAPCPLGHLLLLELRLLELRLLELRLLELLLLELLLLCIAEGRGDFRKCAAHRLRDGIEVAGADLALVLGGRVAGSLRGELRLLQRHVRGHLLRLVAARQLEHRVVERVEAGERDELEAIAHGGELALELRDGRIVELSLPVEGRRAVVGEQLAGELLVDALGELARLRQVRFGGLAPHQVRVGRVGAPARDRLAHARPDVEKALGGTAAGGVDERPVALIDVRGEQGCTLRVVRATSTVGTLHTSAARRAAISLLMASCVGTSTLPPMWPHFLAEESWSSK